MSNVNTHHFPHEGILVVDDTRSDLKYLSSILRKAGYAVRPASDGELALRSVQARLPALILLDINMPGLDGYEVCRRLKDAKDTRDIPVIFISVRTSPLDKVRAFGVGGVDYISKPFEPDEVLARVATHLAQWKAQKEIEEKNLQLQQEIAERVRVEEELRESEERFRALVENSSDIVVVLNSDGGIRYRIPSIEYPLGYELGGLVDKSSIELVHPDDLPAVMNALNDAIQNPGVAQHVECRIQHEDGSWRVVEAIGNNLLDNPAVEGIVITARDITERKRAEEELRKHRDHLEELVAGRTAELRELVNAMAGREIRMAELKDVIRQLRAQLEAAGLMPIADDPLLGEGS